MTEPTEAEFEDMVRRMDQEDAEREAAIVASMPPLTKEERVKLVFWCASIQDESLGRCLIWATTKAQATKEALASLRLGKTCDDDAPPYISGEPERFEVEPTTEALVSWLNCHFTTDNG